MNAAILVKDLIAALAAELDVVERVCDRVMITRERAQCATGHHQKNPDALIIASIHDRRTDAEKQESEKGGAMCTVEKRWENGEIFRPAGKPAKVMTTMGSSEISPRRNCQSRPIILRTYSNPARLACRPKNRDTVTPIRERRCLPGSFLSAGLPCMILDTRTR